jgi:hypothetical protein
MSMDVEKKMVFVMNLTAPVVFKRLSMDRLTNLFQDVQSRVHVHRPKSVTFKDNTICFSLPDYQSKIVVCETHGNFMVTETSVLIKIRTLSEPVIMVDGFRKTITRDRFPKNNIRIMDTMNDVYEYVATLDQVFLTTYGQLKTRLLLYTQYN